MEQFLNRVKQTIIKYDMLQPKEAVLVGVSGGPDSVALLNVLLILSGHFGIRLGVAHINHGIRETEASNEALFVKNLAGEFHLPFFLKEVNVPHYSRINNLSLEEAGRNVRYHFLTEVARREGYDKIALAHHLNDNIESILMFFLRGTGLRGLSGIPPKRDGIFIRPFISVTKHQIHHFLNSNRMDYMQDTTNTDPRFLRNRIRHCLLPVLKKEYNEDIIESVNRLGMICREEEQWLETVIEPIFRTALIAESDHCLHLSRDALKDLHPAATRRVLRRAVKQVKGDLRRIQLIHIDNIINQLSDISQKRWRLDLPDRIQVNHANGQLKISKERRPLRLIPVDRPDNSAIRNYEYIISTLDDCPKQIHIAESGMTLKISKYKAPATAIDYHNRNWAFFDVDRLTFPLTVRNSRPGDRFHPKGMSGTQKLKSFFINCKIPAGERRRIPLVISNQEIIWIAGYRTSGTTMITPHTKRILKAEICLHKI